MLLICLLPVQGVWSQCRSERKQTFLVSDRYQDAAQHGTQLILANSHGLVFRDLEQLAGPPLHIEPLPGDITQVAVRGDIVIATAHSRGVFILKYKVDELYPEQIGFVTIENLEKVKLGENALIASRGDVVSYHQLEEANLQASTRDLLPQLGEVVLDVTHLASQGNQLFVRRSDGKIQFYQYRPQEGLKYQRDLILAGNSLFYGMYYASGHLIVDGLEGISWVRISDEAEIHSSGSLYTNREGDIVLGSYAAGNDLFLRFSDRIDVYSLQGATHSFRGSIPQEFQDIGHVTLDVTGEYLHLMNAAPQRREWSLTTFLLQGNSIQMLAQQEALFEELSAGVLLNGKVYLAAKRDVFQGSELEEQSADLEPLLTFNGNIQEMVASDTLIYITTSVPGTGITRVHAYAEEPEGSLQQQYRGELSGSVSKLSQFGDQLSFLRHVRNTSEDLYRATVLIRDSNNNFRLEEDIQQVPLGGMNPFQDLHLSQLGLVYLRNNQVWVHPQPANLQERHTQTFHRPLLIERVVTRAGHFWIQTESGLYLYGDREGQAIEKGYYKHWRKLKRLPNNLIIAQNVLRTTPGQYHLLYQEVDGIVNDRVAFSTSEEPLFILEQEDILVGERAALNIYEVTCPDQKYEYMLPVRDELELEISTALDATDVVTMKILNGTGQVIGYQDLEPDLIAEFNGTKQTHWMFNYNTFENPATFLLTSSKALSPIVSGAAEDTGGRFAYQVPPRSGNHLYVPHVPKDSGWQTRLYLRHEDISSMAELEIQNPHGEKVSVTFENGSTEEVILQADDYQRPIPWARVVASSLTAKLGGFSQFHELATTRTAAVPLISEMSGYLALPYLARRQEPHAWTGMVLTNPHGIEGTVRIIGYNGQGEIVRDRTEVMEPNSTIVVSAEQWLADGDEADDTRWLALVSNEPIMGMALFGSSSDERLAAIPLIGTVGDTLLFPGIRSSGTERTTLQVANQDARPGTLRITAINGQGEVVDEEELAIGAKRNLSLEVATLFPRLGTGGAEVVQTIRITSENFLAGISFRERRLLPGLEAYCAWVE